MQNIPGDINLGDVGGGVASQMSPGLMGDMPGFVVIAFCLFRVRSCQIDPTISL